MSRRLRLVGMVMALVVVWFAGTRLAMWLTSPHHEAAEERSEFPASAAFSGNGVVRTASRADEPPVPATGEETLRKVAGYVIEIPPAVLATIRHNDHGWHASEGAALDVFLDRVRAVPLNVLERGAGSEFPYAELANSPRRYAGRISTFAGEVRRAGPLEIIRGDGTRQTVYEAWLFSEGGGRKNPYRILCDSLPEGFPTGNRLRQKVGVTGYFFKRSGSATEPEGQPAPMFVAKRFRWSPPVLGTGAREGTLVGRFAASFLALLAVGFGAIAWHLMRHERVQEQMRRRQRARRTLPVDLDRLPKEQPVEDFLRDLGDKPHSEAGDSST